MSKIKASIIIPTKDRLSRLRLVLQALESQVDENSEVIIVFDGCAPETIDKFKELKFSFKPLLVIADRNIGRSAARNRGVRQASGEIIIFLDDDRIPGPFFIKMHLSSHRGKVAVLGERKAVFFSEDALEKLYHTNEIRHNFDKIRATAWTAFDSPFTLSRRLLLRPRSRFPWMPFYTGNVSIAKSDLEKTGLFDENFRGYGYEDLELGYRLFKSQVKIISNPVIVNYHLVHENNLVKGRKSILRNLNYFSRKIKGDFLSQSMLFLLKLVLYFRVLYQLIMVRQQTKVPQS